MKKLLSLLFISVGLYTSVLCQEDGFIATSEGVIHYKIFGNGEPLLIINGGPGLDCEGFVPAAELLSDKYMTILYDQRGTGKSTLHITDSNTVTMDLMVGDIERIRKHLNLDKWIILGHSFGGFMVEYYAVHHPETLKGMVLSSTGGIDLNLLNYFRDNLQMRLSQTERDSLKYWSDKIAAGDSSASAKLNKAKYLASAYLYDKQYVPKLAKRLAFGGYPQITSLVYKSLYKLSFDCREGLKNFEKPVLIIQGRQDPIGEGVAYEAHNALKNSSLVFVNKSGHYAWWEQSEQYKSEVEKFIASIN